MVVVREQPAQVGISVGEAVGELHRVGATILKEEGEAELVGCAGLVIVFRVGVGICNLGGSPSPTSPLLRGFEVADLHALVKEAG